MIQKDLDDVGEKFSDIANDYLYEGSRDQK